MTHGHVVILFRRVWRLLLKIRCLPDHRTTEHDDFQKPHTQRKAPRGAAGLLLTARELCGVFLERGNVKPVRCGAYKMFRGEAPSVQELWRVQATGHQVRLAMSAMTGPHTDAAHAALQALYVGTSDQLLEEHVHGCCRRPSDAARGVQRRRRPIRLLLAAVAVPYLRARLDQKYGSWRRTEWQRVSAAFAYCWPLLHCTSEGAAWVQQWFVAFGVSQHCTPALRALGMTLQRVPRPTTAAEEGGVRLRRYLQTAAFFSLILIRVFEWTVRHETAINAALGEERQRIPPPSRIRDGGAEIVLPLDPLLCPLCTLPRTNPALAPSGVLYCYSCLLTYARRHGACPVTGMPIALDENGGGGTQIRRVFP